ncbi:MAG TPA: S4 domain-containing protein [Deinococcales bacterium]|nr:S4 domain-containing protein [Deinococcales bacterium]
MSLDLRALVAQARGGRVVRTAFVDADTLDRRALASEGVRYAVHGGFADPARVIYTIFPEHIPSVDDPVRVYRLNGEFPPDFRADDLQVALGIPADHRGDIRAEGDLRFGAGFLVATTTKGAKSLDGITSIRALGRELPVEVEAVEGGSLERSNKTRAVVVPSMRVDVVGAKGFGVSRNYFQAGVEAGKVRVNGAPATSSTSIREGDTLTAEGLGRVEFKRVLNETRRGNFKVELEVHR